MSVIAKTAEVTLPACSPQAGDEARGSGAPLSPEDAFPAVVAGSGVALAHMIDLMESAAARLMRPYLRGGESSVVVEMRLLHAAHKQLEDSRRVAVRAVAIHRGEVGRTHRFMLHAFDESGLIGSAEQTRAIVSERRFMAVARKRAGRRSMLLKV